MPFISSTRGSYGPQSGKGRRGPNFLLITGGTITTGGGYRIHTFTSSGQNFVTSTFGAPLSTEYLVVAGGGSGGSELSDQGTGGGGGAGGYRAGTLSVGPGTYGITVGTGGALVTTPNSTPGNDGSGSTFSSITSTGGGGGASAPGGAA